MGDDQGKLGSSLYIIRAGTCRVTIRDLNAPNNQREVSKLHKDNFFGAQTALLRTQKR